MRREFLWALALALVLVSACSRAPSPADEVALIDDLDMGITEVIRGDDHVNNTPRQSAEADCVRAAGGSAGSARAAHRDRGRFHR